MRLDSSSSASVDRFYAETALLPFLLNEFRFYNLFAGHWTPLLLPGQLKAIKTVRPSLYDLDVHYGTVKATFPGLETVVLHDYQFKWTSLTLALEAIYRPSDNDAKVELDAYIKKVVGTGVLIVLEDAVYARKPATVDSEN